MARLVKRAALALVSVVVVAIGCAGESAGQPAPVDIATGLDVPWGIAFLPDGSALIAERDSGAIQRITQPGVVTSVGSVPGVAPRGEGGLLGLATVGQTVFAYLTTAGDNRVVSTRFDGSSFGEPVTVFSGIPAGSVHDGGRIAFGPDGKLYVTTGETGNPGLAQDRTSLAGRILRINPDGSIPADNPDPGVTGVVVRASQCARADVGFDRPAVSHRVRREQIRRAQPHPAARQRRHQRHLHRGLARGAAVAVGRLRR